MTANVLLSSRNLKWRYRITLFLSGILLLTMILIYSIFTWREKRASIETELLARSQQIQNALEAKLSLAQAHVSTMQRTIETHLSNPNLTSNVKFNYLKKQAPFSPIDSPLETLPSKLQSEVGSLQINPSVKVAAEIFQRDINAVLTMLPAVVAGHENHSVFQWSYYYDAKQAWFMIFPKLSREEFFVATGRKNMSSAIEFYFEADGTFPVTMVGPEKNPSRLSIWTPPYMDAGGKGMMVTLLAPIYLGSNYIGAVGTDVTLEILQSIFLKIPPLLGRALVVDNDGILLSDSAANQHKLQTKIHINTILSQVSPIQLKDAPSGKVLEIDNNLWLTFPLKGTTWRLLIQVPIQSLHSELLNSLQGYFGLALGLLGALIGLAWIQNRRFTQPALRLAEFVDEVSENPNAVIPNVPRAWKQWFYRVANTAIERRSYLEETLKHASLLEQKVEDRTIQLKEKNNELSNALREVQILKQQQDGDYFLLSLLIEPLVEINYESQIFQLDFFIKQKKNFEFNRESREIGGDINVCHSIRLGDKNYIVFINADAMGKSLQGAGGILVFASVFKSIIERTKTESKTSNPKKWLVLLLNEIHKVFETFRCSMLLSGAFCLLEEDSGILYYILADHPPIVLYRDSVAKFLETNFIYPKLGLWLLNTNQIQVEKYLMKKGDCLILGSDGRDDICLAVNQKGLPIINQDERLFIRHVENANGELEKIYKEILKIGEQYDDISMIRVRIN